LRHAFLILTIVGVAGCASHDDLYDRMNTAAKPREGLQQAQFAHIGHIDTADGRYEVAVQRLILTGMLAPRGEPPNLLLFSPDGRLVKSFDAEYSNPAEPLSCKGGKIYLNTFGRFNDIPIDPCILVKFVDTGTATGNVIDFSQGIAKAVMLREPL
jgi:hypothetical protein